VSTNGDASSPTAEAESAPDAAPTNGTPPSAISQLRRCPGCDKKNDLDARFRKHCGKSLAEESEPVKEETS
jgi:hypothetical protein